jgi:hypothetical protein
MIADLLKAALFVVPVPDRRLDARRGVARRRPIGQFGAAGTALDFAAEVGAVVVLDKGFRWRRLHDRPGTQQFVAAGAAGRLAPLTRGPVPLLQVCGAGPVGTTSGYLWSPCATEWWASAVKADPDVVAAAAARA